MSHINVQLAFDCRSLVVDGIYDTFIHPFSSLAVESRLVQIDGGCFPIMEPSSLAISLHAELRREAL